MPTALSHEKHFSELFKLVQQGKNNDKTVLEGKLHFLCSLGFSFKGPVILDIDLSTTTELVIDSIHVHRITNRL